RATGEANRLPRDLGSALTCRGGPACLRQTEILQVPRLEDPRGNPLELPLGIDGAKALAHAARQRPETLFDLPGQDLPHAVETSLAPSLPLPLDDTPAAALGHAEAAGLVPQLLAPFEQGLFQHGGVLQLDGIGNVGAVEGAAGQAQEPDLEGFPQPGL